MDDPSAPSAGRRPSLALAAVPLTLIPVALAAASRGGRWSGVCGVGGEPSFYGESNGAAG